MTSQQTFENCIVKKYTQELDFYLYEIFKNPTLKRREEIQYTIEFTIYILSELIWKSDESELLIRKYESLLNLIKSKYN